METQYLAAVFSDSLKYANFFNGRILTATDLRDEQNVTLKRARYLGQAAGEGVVYGLNVTAATGGTALDVSGGLAINRRGDGLSLPGERTTVELVLVDQPTASPTSPFVPCEIKAATTLTGVVSTGFYLLALTSAARPSTELAPHSGLNGSPGCTTRYEEVGVQFKLIPLTNADFVSPLPAGAPDNRSRLAHACFGTDLLLQVASDPAAMPSQYGLVDSLRADGRLTDCDVPLALFHFQSAAVRFVDVWAVRRPCSQAIRVDPAGSEGALTRSTWLDQALAPLVSPRRALEAQAFLLQFQAQLEDLRADSNLNPPAIAASTYFHYLPAAGYLPIQTGSTGRRFRVATFFGEEIPRQELDPAYLRSLFHQSFYEAPLKPGEEAVDLYELPDAPPAEPFVIFVRRPRLVVVPAEDEPAEEEPSGEDDSGGGGTPPPPASGDLVVVVLDESGKVVQDKLIDSVQATDAKGGVYKAVKSTPLRSIGGGYKAKQFERSARQMQEETYNKYGRMTIGQVEETPAAFPAKFETDTVYLFDNLPAGEYAVKANPASRVAYYGAVRQVKVLPNVSLQTAVTIHPIKELGPKATGPFIPLDILTPDGILIDGVWIDPAWEILIPGWEEELPGLDPGNIDPPPELWHELEDPGLVLGIERIFGQSTGLDPGVAFVDPKVYLSAGLDPDQPAGMVNAFVQTQDGARFPLVVLAADNALDKPASVDRTEIKDFDRATVNRLDAAGLAGLDALASAPLPLVAAVLGQSLSYTESLVADSRVTLQDDFRSGYMGYAGIGKAESDALKSAFSDKVEFANAGVEAIAAVLGESFSASFSERLLSDVRQSVPGESFALSGTGMSVESQDALAQAGIETNKAFRDRAATDEGRTMLKETLGISDATLDRYLTGATIEYARGQFLATPDKSIATLTNMPPEVAGKLAGEGIGSAKLLANSDAADLAGRVGIAPDEMANLIGEANNYGSAAHLTLVEGATGGTVSRDAVTEAGFNSPSAIARADVADLERIAGLNPDQAAHVRELTHRFLSGRGGLFRGFR